MVLTSWDRTYRNPSGQNALAPNNPSRGRFDEGCSKLCAQSFRGSRNRRLRVLQKLDAKCGLGIVLDSQVYNPLSEIGRPLEPDAVNTVEGRNSYPMTVPFPFDQGGAVFSF